MIQALKKGSSVVDSIKEVAERASVVEEFGPELVTNEVPYSDPVFPSSVVAEGLYPADRTGQPSSNIRHFGAHHFVEKRLLLDLSLLAISGRGMRGFHVDEDPARAYPNVAVC